MYCTYLARQQILPRDPSRSLCEAGAQLDPHRVQQETDLGVCAWSLSVCCERRRDASSPRLSTCFKYFSAWVPRQAALRPAVGYQVNQNCCSSCENKDVESVLPCTLLERFIGTQLGDCVTTLACYFAFLGSEPAVKKVHLHPTRGCAVLAERRELIW